jgi:hypothetical protein
MSNSLRSIKRRQDNASTELSPEQQKLPTGRVLTGPLRGTFLTFPLLSWISVRQRDRIPLVMLVLALMEAEQIEMRGTLEVELPLYVDTEAATLTALERYGWAGSVWSIGDPPPLDNTDLAELLEGLLGQTTTKLKKTLVFEPDPTTGNAPAQFVEVSRAQGRFLMPPLERPTTPPNEDRVRALRALVPDYRSFFQLEDEAPREVRDEPT